MAGNEMSLKVKTRRSCSLCERNIEKLLLKDRTVPSSNRHIKKSLSSPTILSTKKDNITIAKEQGEYVKPTTIDNNDQVSNFIEAIEKKKELQLCHQKLDLEVAKNIFQALENAQVECLSGIKLRNCDISDEFLRKMLPENLKVIIESLDLSGNEKLGIKALKQLVARCNTSILDLSDINLTAEQIQGLGELKAIKGLKLRACTFRVPVARSINALINAGLETLVLNDSDISGKDLQDIGCNMSDTNELKKIDLSHIVFDKTVAKAVSKIRSKTKKLEWLNLHHCQLDEELLKVLTETEDVNPVNEICIHTPSDVSFQKAAL